MRIYAYHVTANGNRDLAEVLGHIHNLDLAPRLKNVADNDMRLETAIAHRNDRWSLDFTKLRSDGPGRASADEPIEDIDLGEGGRFGEETAAFFDAATNTLVAQYNHYGPRISAIASYLSRFACVVSGVSEVEEATRGFGIDPIVKRDAIERFHAMRFIRNIELSVFVPGALAEHAAGRINDEALSVITASPLAGESQKIHMTFSSGREQFSTLPVRIARNIVEQFRNIPESTSILRVKGKDGFDLDTKVIDFLQETLYTDIEVEMAVGRRYLRERRWSALAEAFEHWRGSRLLE